MHRALLKYSKNQIKQIPKSKQQSQKFSSFSQQDQQQQEKDLFYEAFSHKRNENLSSNSPLKHILDPQQDILNIQQLNQYLTNPQQYIENQKESYKQEMGENFEKFYNRGFRFEVKGLKNQEQSEYIRSALFNNEHGQQELRGNKNLNILENTNYLQLMSNEQQQNSGIQHLISKNEHFSFCLDNYHANEYVSELNDNQVIFFNIPSNSTEQSLTQQLKDLNVNVSSIKISECLTGLPAYAVASLNSQEEALQTTEKLNMKEYLQESLINVRNNQDSVIENSENRTLVVQGISPLAQVQEILQKLSLYGRVMHLEMVEEVVNPTLPNKEEVIAFLKENYENKRFTIVEVQGGIGSSQETKINLRSENATKEDINENQEYHNVGDLQKAQEKAKELKKQQIEDKIAQSTNLYTFQWCNNLNQSSSNNSTQNVNQNDLELVYEYLNEQEKEDIRQRIMEQKQYQNLGYCFVTYASLDSAKIAYGGLTTKQITQLQDVNDAKLVQYQQNWQNISVFLKQSSDHYHYDANHLLERFSNISSEFKLISDGIQQDSTKDTRVEQLKEKQQEIRQELIKQSNDVQVSRNIRETLKNQLLTEKTHSVEFNAPLNYENIGRDFSTHSTIDEFKQFQQELQADWNNKKAEQIKYEQIDQNNLENYYKQQLKSVGVENLVDPLQQLTADQKTSLLQNLKSQEKARISNLIEEENSEQFKVENFEDTSRGLLRAAKRKNERQQNSQQKKRDKVVRKEQRLNEDSGAEFSVQTKGYKLQKYSKFVEELKTMISGDFETELKQQMFKKHSNNFNLCRDNLGNFFYSQQEADRVQQYTLPKDQEKKNEYLQKLQNHSDMLQILPEQWSEKLNNINDIESQTIKNLSQQCGIPIESFNIDLPEDQSIEQYVKELNLFAAEMGEEYVISENEDNKPIVLKVLKPVKTPELRQLLEIANIQFNENNLNNIQNNNNNEKQNQNNNSQNNQQQQQGLSQVQLEMVQSFEEMGLSREEAELETVFFFKHHEYSEKINNLMTQSIEALSEQDIEQYCLQNNISRQNLEMIMNISDLESEAQAVNSLQSQIEDIKSDKLYGNITKEDLIKNQQAQIKDEKDQYINSTFKSI